MSMTPRERMMAVVIEIAYEHRVRPHEIMSRSGARPIVRARNAAIREVNRLEPHLSTTQLGRFFGRHSTTILHSLGRRTGRQPSV